MEIGRNCASVSRKKIFRKQGQKERTVSLLNWLDLLLLWMICWSSWRGVQTGLVAGLAQLCGLFIGLALAREYQALLAAYLRRQIPLEQWIKSWFAAPAIGLGPGPLSGWNQHIAQGVLETLSFIAILLVATRLIGWLGQLLARSVRFSFLGPADRVGGLILGIARGIMVATIFLAITFTFQNTVRSWLPGETLPWLTRAVEGSRLTHFLTPAIDALQQLIPVLLARYN